MRRHSRRTLAAGLPARQVRNRPRPRLVSPTLCTSSLCEASSTMRVPPRELPHCFQSSRRVLDSTEKACLCCSGVSRPPPPLPLASTTQVPREEAVPELAFRPKERMAGRIAPNCGPHEGTKGSRATCSLPTSHPRSEKVSVITFEERTACKESCTHQLAPAPVA